MLKSNRDECEWLRRLVDEAINLVKNFYFIRNDLGIYGLT